MVKNFLNPGISAQIHETLAIPGIMIGTTEKIKLVEVAWKLVGWYEIHLLKIRRYGWPFDRGKGENMLETKGLEEEVDNSKDKCYKLANLL